MARLSDGGAPTTVSYAALDAAKDRLNDLDAQFEDTISDVGARHDQVLAGAGEFRGQLEMVRVGRRRMRTS